MLTSLRFGIILSIPQTLYTTQPKLCQNKANSVLYRISDVEECNNLKIQKILIRLSKANIKSYTSTAKGVKYITKSCKTKKSFWGDNFKDESYNIVTLPQYEAKSMVEERKCKNPEGGYRNSDFNQGYVCNYSWMKNQKSTTSTCLFVEGKIYASHSGAMKSTLTDVTNCHYLSGQCETNGYSLFWIPNKNIINDYINPIELNVTRISNHILIDSLALSFDLNKMIYSKNLNVFRNGAHELKILNVYKSPSQTKLTGKLKADTDIANQIVALQSEIQDKYRYLLDMINSPEGRINRLCTALKQTNIILKSFLKQNPTKFTQLAMRNNNVYSIASENYLIVWPCKQINLTEITWRLTNTCYNMIPIFYNKKEGFLDLNLIYHEKATELNCKLSPTKLFEFGKEIYTQKKNEIPKLLHQDNVQFVSAYTEFNFSKLPDLPNNWSFTSEDFEYHDTASAAASKLREEILNLDPNNEKNKVAQSEKDKFHILGLRTTAIYGIFDCVLTWITRIGSILAFYLFFKAKNPDFSGFLALIQRKNP